MLLTQECRITLSECKRLPGIELENRLRDACAIRDLRSPAHLNATIVVGLDLALTAYAHTHPNVQYYVALYTMLLTLIDNQNVSTQALEEYVSRGVTAGQPILEWLAECLSSTHEHFVPYAAGAIAASTMGYISGEILDASSSTDDKKHWPLSFVEYKRLKSGDPEAYAFFIFDKYSFPGVQSYVHIIPYVPIPTLPRHKLRR